MECDPCGKHHIFSQLGTVPPLLKSLFDPELDSGIVTRETISQHVGRC